MKIQIVNGSVFDLPKAATALSAGIDLKADFTELVEKGFAIEKGEVIKHCHPKDLKNCDKVILKPQSRVILPTNLKIQLPEGYEAHIRPRSGLSIKKGLTVMFGTIDADYTGDIGIICANFTNEPIEIEHGERVAQMVIAKHESVVWEEVEVLNETDRGEGGFGHTGTK